jgi:hypothetical protein
VTFSGGSRHSHVYSYAPPANDLILEVKPGSFPHRIDDLENTDPAALAKVVSLVASFVRTVVKDVGVRLERIERKQVPRRQVDHMNVVPEARTVPGSVSDDG